ncbi:uncharacterized protein [Argopecten irradians]|uniref:uncharacterized protein n=1 Tax=Argopecten irradians TaxID=31199 RepID=UPI0037109FA3
MPYVTGTMLSCRCFEVVLVSIQCIFGMCLVPKNVSVLQGNYVWGDGFNQPGCQLLGQSFTNQNLDDIRVFRASRLGVGRTQEYWIAARVQYTKWMQIRGCFLIDSSRYKSVIGRNNVKECSSYCEGSSFGLTSERCFCFDTTRTFEDEDYDDYCRAAKCPRNGDELCGNTVEGRRSCICVYEPLNLAEDNEIGNCKIMQVNREDRTFRTKDCDERHSFLCQRRSGRNDVELYKNEVNWAYAGLACHREHRRQFYSGNFDIRNLPNGQHWIGIFRQETFQWGNTLNQNGYFDCISVTINMDGVLETSVNNCNTTLPLLCEAADKSDDTTTHMDVNSTISRDDLNVRSLVVGIAVGVVTTLVIVLTALAILRHRKKVVEERAIVNGRNDDNLDANYDHLNPRESAQYCDLQQNAVTYDYISSVDTNRDYLEIVEG